MGLRDRPPSKFNTIYYRRTQFEKGMVMKMIDKISELTKSESSCDLKEDTLDGGSTTNRGTSKICEDLASFNGLSLNVYFKNRENSYQIDTLWILDKETHLEIHFYYSLATFYDDARKYLHEYCKLQEIERPIDVTDRIKALEIRIQVLEKRVNELSDGTKNMH